MTGRKMSEWNKALEAAAKLVGKDGYTFIRRKLADDMTCAVEIRKGDPTIRGDYDEAVHVPPDDMAKAAILSLRRSR